MAHVTPFLMASEVFDALSSFLFPGVLSLSFPPSLSFLSFEPLSCRLCESIHTATLVTADFSLNVYLDLQVVLPSPHSSRVLPRSLAVTHVMESAVSSRSLGVGIHWRSPYTCFKISLILIKIPGHFHLCILAQFPALPDSL